MFIGAQLQIPTYFCGKPTLKIYLSTHSWQLLRNKVKILKKKKKDSICPEEKRVADGQVTSKRVECKGYGGSEKQQGGPCKCYYGINNVSILKRGPFGSAFQKANYKPGVWGTP